MSINSQTQMKQIKHEAIFKDKFGANRIMIHNDFKELSFELRGAKFKGSSLDDFELLNLEQHSKKELQQFSFNKFTGKTGDLYELCGYELQFCIPTVIFDVQESTYLQSAIKVTVKTGSPAKNGEIDFVEIDLNLKIKEQVFEGKSDFFEVVANQIEKQFKGKYRFKNCFGCNYSDYSVYGQGLFASMLCFTNQKNTYSKVKNKSEYMSLNSEKRSVQETFVCEEFAFRKENIGYRG